MFNIELCAYVYHLNLFQKKNIVFFFLGIVPYTRLLIFGIFFLSRHILAGVDFAVVAVDHWKCAVRMTLVNKMFLCTGTRLNITTRTSVCCLFTCHTIITSLFSNIIYYDLSEFVNELYVVISAALKSQPRNCDCALTLYESLSPNRSQSMCRHFSPLAAYWSARKTLISVEKDLYTRSAHYPANRTSNFV